jgi:hypothetical protein
MKKNLLFIFLMSVILLVLIAISGNDFPPIPADSDHIPVADTSVCMGCHGPDAESSMKEEHPPKFECFKCHKPLKTVMADG